MTTKQLLISFVIAAPVAVALAVYIGLLSDGSIPPPNFAGIANNIGLGATTAAQIVLVLAILAIGVMAALAPIIYAVRSGDVVTILISLVLTGGAIVMLFISRTVMDQISALIIYLANIILSAIVYAARRISDR
jgi:hypothetical protein